jgi:glycosyltransferase involved in cell wall biosynthesis
VSDTISHTLPIAPVEKAENMCATEKGSPWMIVAGGFHRDGGMDKANLALAEYLVERGTRVHLVCHRIDPDFSRHQLVTLHSVGCPAGSFFLGEPLLDMRARVEARKLQVTWPNLPVIVNGGNCLWPGINWVHYVHHAWKPGWRSAPAWFGVKQVLTECVIRRRERQALRRAKLLIANSERTAQHLVEYFGIDAHRIRTVYLGGESEWRAVTAEERASSRNALQLPPARPIAVFVGGLGYDDRKGFDVLFEAWRRLCARPDWDVDLLVAGSGNALRMWQRRTSETGLTARIRLLGFLREIPGLLAAADLLVSPVRYEAYGLNV